MTTVDWVADWFNAYCLTTTTTTILWPFFRRAGAKRKLFLDFMVLGRITKGKHTDNPGGCHSIRTNQQSTSINPPIFTLHALPAATLPFILAWDRHRNMLHCINPWLGLMSYKKQKQVTSETVFLANHQSALTWHGTEETWPNMTKPDMQQYIKTVKHFH